jgi:hypothetical protein
LHASSARHVTAAAAAASLTLAHAHHSQACDGHALFSATAAIGVGAAADDGDDALAAGSAAAALGSLRSCVEAAQAAGASTAWPCLDR